MAFATVLSYPVPSSAAIYQSFATGCAPAVNSFQAGTISVSAAGCSATATIETQPFPYLRAETHGESLGNIIAAGAGTQLRYTFRVTGPALTNVPILIAGLVTVIADTTNPSRSIASASALLQLDPGFSPQRLTPGPPLSFSAAAQWLVSRGRFTDTVESEFDETFLFSGQASTGLDFVLGLSAGTSLGNGGGFNPGDNLSFRANGYAYIDPYIYIEPVWSADHPGYQIVVEAGIGNAIPAVTPPVPEAPLFPMLCVGLALLSRIHRKTVGPRRLGADASKTLPTPDPALFERGI